MSSDLCVMIFMKRRLQFGVGTQSSNIGRHKTFEAQNTLHLVCVKQWVRNDSKFMSR